MQRVDKAWPLPDWVADLKGIEREQALTRFLLCQAQLFMGPKASTADLSTVCGLSPNQINVMKTRGRVTGEVAVAIEKNLGRELFSREFFRPDLFVVAE